MSTNNRVNEATVRSSLEGMLKSLSTGDYLSYFQFLVVARQLSFRFESQESLAKLKSYFQKAADKLRKQDFLQMLEFKGYQVVNNIRMQYAQIKQARTIDKSRPLTQGNYRQLRSLMKKVDHLRAFLEEYHGKKQEEWFRLFDMQGKGAIRYYEMKWTMRTFMNQYITDDEIRTLFSALKKVHRLLKQDQSGAIHASQFIQLFNPQTLKRLLEESYQNRDSKDDLHMSHEVKIRQYPMMILTTGASTPTHHSRDKRLTTQDSYTPSRRNSVNLKYYKPARKTYQQLDYQPDSSFKLTFYGGKERQSSLNNTCGSEAFRRASHTEGPTQQLEKIGGRLAVVSKKRSRYTKASQLRKKFIYQEILPREKLLQQQRFRTFSRDQTRSQILGQSLKL